MTGRGQATRMKILGFYAFTEMLNEDMARAKANCVGEFQGEAREFLLDSDDF